MTNHTNSAEATQGAATAQTTNQEINNGTADVEIQRRCVVAGPTQPNNQSHHSNKANIMANENFKQEGTSNPDTYTEALIFVLGSKVPKKTRAVLTSYLAAKRAGLKIAFLECNRKVHFTQVEKLLKSIKGKGKFTQACLVVPLRPILEKFPDLKVYDSDGNLITTDSPDLDMYVVPYDGQHRIAACELKPADVDVELELMDFDGENPLTAIKLMNSYSRNWNNDDLRTSNLCGGLTNNKLYEEAAVLQRKYGITRKLAEYILTFVRDATKKQDLVAGRDTTTYKERNGERGKTIFAAVITNFNNAREVKKLPLMDSIVKTHVAFSDDENVGFTKYMKLYLGRMDEDDRKEVLSYINEKNFGQLDEFIRTGYEAFFKTHNDEAQLSEMEVELDRRINSFMENLEQKNQEKLAKVELKSGRVHEILEQHRKVISKCKEDAEQKAKEKRDRAEAAVEKAKKKAEKADRDYESLQNVNSGNDSAEN